MAHEVETMFYVREVPWHGLGTRVEEAPDSEQALVLAGLAWAVEQRPVFVDGNEVEEYVANVRSTDGRVLGIVGRRYRVLQNREAFAFTDALLGEGVRYETAGALNGGRRVWLLARLDPTQILGDEVVPYLVFTNNHDGTAAVKAALTPVRVVCQNTLNLALQGANRIWSVRHTLSIHDRLDEAARTLGLARRYMERLDEFARHMVAQPFEDSDWQGLVEKLIPMPENPKKPDGVAVEHVFQRRQALHEALQAVDLEPFRKTKWGALQAVVDFAQHFPPIRKTETWRERRFERTIDGDPLIDKALALLT
ncbi:DUF932 domain-containing protein [Caldinitratiruptor microaerophilus]|uniref:Uncharacterized protein n=1 Tax=Caldinitratiruptor microaerophilus TaxID=671077 RepID=A0AA35G6W3_9FIRM|nr:DUF932 domain-containing protein [Caldinitratiruptor microaerophilus]BDG61951.1 hypothetical protein caldi_30410 [Caldinitratiruptor microaerophilus]